MKLENLAPHKGKKQRLLPSPGPELVQVIEELADRGRPVWHVPGSTVVVPQLSGRVRVAESRFVIPRLSLGLPGEEYFQPRTWLALQGVSDLPADRWAYPPKRVPPPLDRIGPHDPRAQVEAVALLAAVYRDLMALRPATVALKLELIRGVPYDVRKARRAAKDGRALWARLAAWPWLVSADYDAEWWRREDVIELWHEWASTT